MADQESESRAFSASGKNPFPAPWTRAGVKGLDHYRTDGISDYDSPLDEEEQFRGLSDALPLGIFILDADGACVYANAAYQRISGLSFDEALGSRWSAALHPDDQLRVCAEWAAAMDQRVPFVSEARFRRPDGSIVWVRLQSAAMASGERDSGHLNTVEDITQRKTAELMLRTAEEALHVERERAQITLRSIGDAVLTTDLEGTVVYMNPAAETMTGWRGDEARGRALAQVLTLIDGRTRLPSKSPARRAMEQDRTVTLALDSVLVRRDGSEVAVEDSAAPIHDSQGRTIGAVIVFHDVSKTFAMAQEMAHLARHDFLTGLPNRALLTERLTQAIGQAARHDKQIALLFVDLDRFKHINDSVGHAIGDQLLRSVADRLLACVRATDTVCRQGGDEFVILLAEIDRPEDAAQVAEKLLAALALPHRIGELELQVRLSVGISVYPSDGADADTLLRNADTAMYDVKASGRNDYRFFRKDMGYHAAQSLVVEGRLGTAIGRGEFLLDYQPRINIASGATTGAEVLVHWRDSELGLLAYASFLPAAEDSGLIVPIGTWVLNKVCRQIRAWQDAGLATVPVSVGISATEFRHRGFLDGFVRILRETGVAAELLEFRLTETVLMKDVTASFALLQALRAMGVRLVLDDFGTGYSSPHSIRWLPVDAIRIDQSFVRDIGSECGTEGITAAMIAMGKSLNKLVLVAGIETPAQLAFVREQHCDEAQGELFGRPLPAERFAHLIERGASPLPGSTPA